MEQLQEAFTSGGYVTSPEPRARVDNCLEDRLLLPGEVLLPAPEAKPTHQLTVTQLDFETLQAPLTSEQVEALVGRLLRRERQPGAGPG